MLAQDPIFTANDDLGQVTDAFQEEFFEALKQKGIENYELALSALDRAEKAALGNEEQLAVIGFEKAKNLTQLKRYQEAELSLLQVLETTGNRLDVMEALYNVYYQQRDYEKAIPLVKELVKEDEDYKEDLVNLYFNTKRYDEALELLDDLDESWGDSVYRDTLRRRIYSITGNSEGAIDNLESKIDKNPKNEQDYLNLIYLYSQEGNTQKAFELAEQLLKEIPSAKKAHLAMYKHYLEQNQVDKAISSMKEVFGASDIPKESKFKMLSDFLEFVSMHPEHEPTLNEILPTAAQGGDGSFFESLGMFFVKKGNPTMALELYERGVAMDSDNYNLIKNTLLLQIDNKMFQKAADLSESSLAIFPAQPLLYLLNGVANNGLGKSDNAITNLEMGLDFLLDDPKMERDFYLQLSEAYNKKGNVSKSQQYKEKASQLQISN